MANAEWRYLQPEKLTIDPNSHLAEEEWKFWLKTFTNFVEALPRGENTVDQGCPTRKPQATCGPPKLSKWPVKLSTLVS